MNGFVVEDFILTGTLPVSQSVRTYEAFRISTAHGPTSSVLPLQLKMSPTTFEAGIPCEGLKKAVWLTGHSMTNPSL